MGNRVLALGLVTLIIVSGCGQANQGILGQVDRFVEDFNKATTAGQVNGHIFVAREGEVLLNKGYGKADYDSGIDISQDTVFLIGSLTKPITAIAIMQLHDAGLLDISEPVSKYIPDQTRGDEITISQLLSHTSGLVRDAGVNYYQPIAREVLVAIIAARPLDHSPGSQYQYSNAGYSLLAWIVEIVSGQTYEDYLQEHIFSPLGMDSTGAVANNQELPSMATGHYVADSKVKKELASIFELSVFWGAGNVYSTASDLYSLDRALYTDKVLARDTTELMMEKGLGWGKMEFNGHNGIGHNGLLYNGYSATFLRFPAEDMAVIVLMNVSNRDNVSLNIGQALTTIVSGQEYALPQVQKMITLPEAELQKYAGNYELEGGPVTIRVARDHLVLEPLGYEFVPASETVFFVQGSEYRRIEFSIDANGNVTGFKLRECVVDFTASRN